MRKILCNLLNPISPTTTEFLTRVVLTIGNGKIISIDPEDNKCLSGCEDFSEFIAIPGLIDLHVHLSQYRIRGRYEPALLPWLDKNVFPEEAKSADYNYAEGLAKDFYAALAKAGTTFSVIYTAPYYEACRAAFVVAEKMKVRAYIGMTLMDANSPVSLKQSTTYALDKSFALYDEWHGKYQGLDYIFTPRFAPTCSLELMKEISRFAIEHKAWIQTHLSENRDELIWVKEIFGLNSYTEVYEKANLVTSNSIFAHAIHLQSKELDILKSFDAKIAHCPDSNFYLKSGEFPMQRILESGLEFGLGSDVGAGTSLNMLYHAKMMNFRQSIYPILPEESLYRATLGSATLLGMEDKIGSLDIGKEADIVFLAPPNSYTISEQTLSQLCFFGSEFEVIETIAAGNTLYKNERSLDTH